MKKIVFLLLVASLCGHAQNDSLHSNLVKGDSLPRMHVHLTAKKIILPVSLISFGALGIHNGELSEWNAEVKEEIQEHNAGFHFHADDYLQFAPAAMVFALQAAGIKGAHSVKDEALLYAAAMGITTIIVYPAKKVVHELRPDGSNYRSFPSGHTAVAFASAEFLRREYKDVSAWYGVAGYGAAFATGLLRLYNNKHWLNDIIAGAGVGLASTTLSYWMYDNWLSHSHKHGKNTVLFPVVDGHTVGLSCIKMF